MTPRLLSSCIAQPRATTGQKRVGWGMAARIKKILCTVLHEAYEQQVEEVMDTLAEGPEGFYNSYLD